MSEWLNYEDFPDTCDAYCWAEIKRSESTYVTMCRWWEDVLYFADDGPDVDYSDRIPEQRVIGVMPIEKPETTFVPTDNVRFIGRSSR